VGDYFEPIISTLPQIRLLSELPPFLSATRKQELLEKAVRMEDSTLCRAWSNSRFDLPLMRLIQRRAGELPKEGRVLKIRMEVFDKCGVTLTPGVIREIIKQGQNRLKYDEKVVEAYTQFLKLRISFPHEPKSKHARKVVEETGIVRHVDSITAWARSKSTPRSIKRAISDNHPLLDEELLEHYPHLRKYKSLLDGAAN
jgi:hypothetical protein